MLEPRRRRPGGTARGRSGSRVTCTPTSLLRVFLARPWRIRRWLACWQLRSNGENIKIVVQEARTSAGCTDMPQQTTHPCCKSVEVCARAGYHRCPVRALMVGQKRMLCCFWSWERLGGALKKPSAEKLLVFVLSRMPLASERSLWSDRPARGSSVAHRAVTTCALRRQEKISALRTVGERKPAH